MKTELNDCDTPESVAPMLRAAANMFRDSQSELASAWQDPDAGKVWSRIARILDRAADSVEREVAKS